MNAEKQTLPTAEQENRKSRMAFNRMVRRVLMFKEAGLVGVEYPNPISKTEKVIVQALLKQGFKKEIKNDKTLIIRTEDNFIRT